MLPVMATVLFTPGLTVGELAERAETQELWAACRSSPGSMPPEEWRINHDKAVDMLTKVGMVHARFWSFDIVLLSMMLFP
jgi:hypothetical protein